MTFIVKLDKILSTGETSINVIIEKLNVSKNELFSIIQEVGGYSTAGILSNSGTIKRNKKFLTGKQVISALNDGKKVTLPEWDGYWFSDNGTIKVFTKYAEILNTPWLELFDTRNDWEIYEENHNAIYDFGYALNCMKAGKKVARKGWNGAGMYVKLNLGDQKTKIRPYYQLFTAQKDFASWAPSTSDSLSEDWVIVK